jgi:hypothetical protein
MNFFIKSFLIFSFIKKEKINEKNLFINKVFLHLKICMKLCRIDPLCEILCTHNFSFNVPRKRVVICTLTNLTRFI